MALILPCPRDAWNMISGAVLGTPVTSTTGETVSQCYGHQDRWYRPVSDPDEIDERVNWQISTGRR